MSDLTVANLALGGLLGGLGLALLIIEARDWRRRHRHQPEPNLPIEDILQALRSERAAEFHQSALVLDPAWFEQPPVASSRLLPVTPEEFSAEVERGMDAIGRYLAARAGQI
jgi:hypothetical protein